MKFYALLILLLLTNAPAFAFSIESGPNDVHGAALTDPDEKFDNLDEQGRTNGQSMQFGDGTIWMGAHTGSPQTVQTGKQLFEPALNFGGGR